MNPEDLCFAGAAEQARMVRGGQISATELVEATLARIAVVDPKINAFSEVFADEARQVARDLDANRASDGRDRPLLGVPIALKDNIAIAGHTTNWGTSAVTEPAAADAPLVARLRDAGAVIVGKTTCSELAVWPFTETPAWGATRNPWDTDFTPGGSSGGSGAAVAAGLCGLAVGSDGLGSIRVPAGFCGVFGVKPQRDRVWHEPGGGGWFGLSVNGPLCRSVADAALFLDVADTGQTPPSFHRTLADPLHRPLRIAVAWNSAAYYPLAARTGSEQRAAVDDTASILRDLGHSVVEHKINFPMATGNSYIVRYLSGIADSMSILQHPERLSKRTLMMARFGDKIPDRVLAWAMRAEAGYSAKINQVFDDADVVLTPGAVEAPLRIGELDGRGAIRTLYGSGRKIPHFAPWNAVGQPAVSVPTGLSEAGLPLSVQLAGSAHDEATLLALASQLERERPWSAQRPPV